MPDLCAVAFHRGFLRGARSTPCKHVERCPAIVRHRQWCLASKAQVTQVVCALSGVWLLRSYCRFVVFLAFVATRLPRKIPPRSLVGRPDAGLACRCIPIVVVAANPDDDSHTQSVCTRAAYLQVCVPQFPPDPCYCLQLAAVLCKPSCGVPDGIRVVRGLLVDLVLPRCSH